MAVEARHMNIFPPQLITNRDFVKNNQGNGGLYNSQMDYCIPLVDTMQQSQQLWPLYQSLACDPVQAKTSMNKDDSGLTYNIPAVTAPRKRPRDNTFSDGFDAYQVPQKNKFSAVSSFLDEDIISHIHQQQQELDRYLAEHTEKLRMELEETRKRQSRMLITVIQERVVKKLKEKDEEIQKMGKLNWELQEKVKSLSVQNQLWRDLAQTNEATANSLRSNLEQVLAHVSEERHVSGATVADDCESSCGSSNYGRENVNGMRTASVAEDKAVVGGGGGSRACRKCGERESSVLLLPCRHLCLCTMCGSSLVGTCPVCDSAMNASLHINMS
ncbi:hypothetical protein SLE2022_386570 [Rubroshorea leprosula]